MTGFVWLSSQERRREKTTANEFNFVISWIRSNNTKRTRRFQRKTPKEKFYFLICFIYKFTFCLNVYVKVLVSNEGWDRICLVCSIVGDIYKPMATKKQSKNKTSETWFKKMKLHNMFSISAHLNDEFHNSWHFYISKTKKFLNS